MKKFIVTFGIILAGICYVNAQDKADSKMLDHLTQVCQLSPDQVSKVKPIIENYVSSRKANKQKYAGDKTAMKSADKALKENYKSQLKTVLTPDQMERLKADIAQHKTSKKGGQQQEQE